MGLSFSVGDTMRNQSSIGKVFDLMLSQGSYREFPHTRSRELTGPTRKRISQISTRYRLDTQHLVPDDQFASGIYGMVRE